MINKLSSLKKNETFMRYLGNSSWMLTEYALKIASAIFVSIYVARYLGPEKFGLLSYALAIVSIFMAVSRLGMDSILVRDLSKHPEQTKAYMGTAFGLMFGTAILAMFVLTVLISLFESDAENKLYIWIISIGLIFQTFLAIDYGFQAQVKAKFSSIAKSMALGISSIIKIYLVVTKADLQLFAVAYALDHAIIAIMLVATHVIKKQPVFLFAFDRALVKPMLKSAWPMVLSAVCFMLYSRLDQLMIKYYLGVEQLGLYSAAAKIFEGWSIVPYILMISLFPMIVRIKKTSSTGYHRMKVYIFRVFLMISLGVAGFSTIFSKEIIAITFGQAFDGASAVFAILMWASVFTTMGTITVRLLVVENIEKKILKITSVGLIVNFILNFILIPIFGIIGGAFATLLSLFSAYYLHDYFDKQMEPILIAKNTAIVFLRKI